MRGVIYTKILIVVYGLKVCVLADEMFLLRKDVETRGRFGIYKTTFADTPLLHYVVDIFIYFIINALMGFYMI